jgi:hypothetical protein
VRLRPNRGLPRRTRLRCHPFKIKSFELTSIRVAINPRKKMTEAKIVLFGDVK